MRNFLLLIVFYASLFAQPVHALDLEKLFMPGKVIEGHKKLENDCKQCHVRLRDTTQRQLCLDCHEKVEQDLVDTKGFHSKNEKASDSDCKVCHADHKGRDANIVWLDKDRFDHELTDYSLTGKHQQLECLSCHEQKDKYRDAPHECIDCHKDDDIHETKLGDECANCHNPKAWTGKQFDHDKTDYKLKFAHEKVACDLCHVNNVFKKTPTKCVACHAIKDVHENRFGKKCQSCHNEKKWDITLFNHDKDTDYKLTGKHRKVSCHTCHLPPPKSSKTKSSKKKSENKKNNRNCYSCHRLDDVHQQKNGKKCKDCHNQKSWLKTSFDHDKKTDFALKGAHKKTSCQACHQNDIKGNKTSMLCYDCHQSNDVHQKQLGEKCGECHNETDWIGKVRFDHELSNYPLIGQHAVVGCENCHLTAEFKNVNTQCNECHASNDIHKKSLGHKCQQCHNSNDWLIWEFEHDETDFKLKGAHVDVYCHRCHIEPMKDNQGASRRCIDCHIQDDLHDGGFGSDCDDCHTQDDFKTIQIRSLRSYGR